MVPKKQSLGATEHNSDTSNKMCYDDALYRFTFYLLIYSLNCWARWIAKYV